MNDPRLIPYLKKFPYAYTIGVYPTIDLLKIKPDKAIKIILNRHGLEDPHVKNILAICHEKGIKTDLQDRAIQKIAPKENTYCIGIFEKYESEISEKENHVVLVNPRNLGNIGTIIRTMVGFGVNNLVMIKPAADIYDPKVISSTVGAFFSVQFRYFDSFLEYSSKYTVQYKYAFMLGGDEYIQNIEFKKPFSLIFGNENEGLEMSYRNTCKPVTIKHSHDVDSLNLSVSTGIALYQATKDLF